MSNMHSFPGKTRSFFARTASLAFIAATVFFAPACHKSNGNSNPTYYLKASINGKDTTFSVNALAKTMSAVGYNDLILEGSYKSGLTFPGLTFTIASTSAIVAGTYTSGTYNTGSVSAVYYPTGSNALYGPSEGVTGVNPFTIVITSLDTKTVKGTFSGDLAIIDFNGNVVDKKTFTNGQFNLQF